MTTVMDTPSSLGMTHEEFVHFALSAADGFRVEQINGEIYVTPPAGGDHDEDAAIIGNQFMRAMDGVLFHGAKGLYVPGYRSDHAIPDGVIALEGTFRGAPEYAEPSAVMGVIEVTSKGREDVDRTAKRAAYARAGIPVYILVDRKLKEVAVFHNPDEGVYADVHVVPFGRPVELPEPFKFTLKTDRLT